MNYLFAAKFVVAGAIMALGSFSHAATTTYVRGAAPCWNTAAEDLVAGSDSEVGGATNLWRYEIVDGVAAENGLAGATPWFTLPAATTESFVWNAGSSRWDWAAGGVVDPNNDKPAVRAYFVLQESASQYGKVPRVVWTAPESGKASFTGALGFKRGTGGTNPVVFEWAIGKKSGTTYTKLASGASAPTTTTQVNVTLSASDLTALTDIPLNAGEGVWWSVRPQTNPGDDKLDNIYDSSSGTVLTLSFTPGAVSSVSNWHNR